VTEFQWISVLLSLITLMLIPTVISIIRIAMRWVRTEDKLDVLIQRVNALIHDKDEVHQELQERMREDREASDKRLRWLETNLWMRRK
jgi:hypothetical protein